jgi:hypothetical protein
MTTYSKADLVDAYRTLRMLKDDLPDVMWESILEWKDEISEIDSTDQESINNLVEWLNQICDDETYPHLLPTELE